MQNEVAICNAAKGSQPNDCPSEIHRAISLQQMINDGKNMEYVDS